MLRTFYTHFNRLGIMFYLNWCSRFWDCITYYLFFYLQICSFHRINWSITSWSAIHWSCEEFGRQMWKSDNWALISCLHKIWWFFCLFYVIIFPLVGFQKKQKALSCHICYEECQSIKWFIFQIEFHIPFYLSCCLIIYFASAGLEKHMWIWM